MEFDRRDLTDEFLRELYRDLLFPRMVEEKMLILLRQGKISKWFSGMGQEAIAVGATKALQAEDYVLPLHRNLGVFTTRGVPLKRLLCQWLGKPEGFTQGRDRSFHFGSEAHRIIGMISHLGAMLPVADGLALAGKLDKKDFIAVPFSGDGGASEGDFHEALNVASVWELPVLFIIENNGYGLSTPTWEQFKAKKLALRAEGYGMKGYSIDGNNVLEVYHVVSEIVRHMRENKQPVLLECKTFRMRGHEEASGTKYVPENLMEAWAKRDPIRQYEQFLKEADLYSDGELLTIKKEFKVQINQTVKDAFEAPALTPNPEQELAQVYAPRTGDWMLPNGSEKQEVRYIDAISQGLRQAMERHPNLVLMGQDIAEYGGVFKITDGFMDQFGKARVRNTPLCESAIVGTAMGLSLGGKKAMMEMQFADFVSCGFNQIVNNLAKTHYRWGHAPDVVIRMPTGGGMGAGPFHSQSNESWFTHVPGLKVVYPAFPDDAKGLLTAAFADPNPVMYFEHKFLYRSLTGSVPASYYETPIGQARVIRQGEALTVVSYGLGVHWALDMAEQGKYDLEIIDLRTLIPWDQKTVFDSVKKTGKCLVLYEDTQTGAFGAEIAASISEQCFEWLDGPVCRVGSMDTPVPFHPELEARFLAKSRLQEKIETLLAY